MVTLEALKPLGVKPDQIRLVQNDIDLPRLRHVCSKPQSLYERFGDNHRCRETDGCYEEARWNLPTYEEMVAEGSHKYEGTHQNTAFPGICRLDQYGDRRSHAGVYLCAEHGRG